MDIFLKKLHLWLKRQTVLVFLTRDAINYKHKSLPTQCDGVDGKILQKSTAHVLQLFKVTTAAWLW